MNLIIKRILVTGIDFGRKSTFDEFPIIEAQFYIDGLEKGYSCIEIGYESFKGILKDVISKGSKDSILFKEDIYHIFEKFVEQNDKKFLEIIHIETRKGIITDLKAA